MTLTLHTLTRSACLALAMSTLAACPEGKSETDSATDATTSATAAEQTTTSGDVPTTSESTISATSIGTLTEAMSGTSTTSPTTEGTTANTTVDVETTTASTTEGTTEGTSTTGAIPEALEGACQSACDKFFECIPQPPFPDLDTCVAECAGALGMGPTCLENTVAFNSCIGEMSCDELEDAFVNEEFGPCEDEFAAMGAGCQPCEGFGSAGPDACSTGQQCPEQPKQEFSCEGETCTCLVDDQAVSDCPAPAAICDGDEEDLAMAAFDCCGFEF